MTSISVTAKELQKKAPKAFQKEYENWLCYYFKHDWWDSLEEDFKMDMAKFGVDVDCIRFSLGYCQSDYAAFKGAINMRTWMDTNSPGSNGTYSELYPALAIDMENSDADISVTNYGNPRISLSLYGDNPSGIFSELDQDTWDDLVEEQFTQSDIENDVRKWVEGECKELYRRLQDEYEAISSEEEFIEYCHANDVTFDLDVEDHEVPGVL